MMFSRRVRPSSANPRISSPLAPSASQSVSPRSGGASALATAGSSSWSLVRIWSRERRVALRGFAQVPDAVADVALLVVVDVAVAIDEPGQQLVVRQVARDELKRRQPERALDHQVIDRHEVDLRERVDGVGGESFVGGHERLVEDDRERVAELFT